MSNTPRADALADWYSDVDLIQVDGLDEAILGIAEGQIAYSLSKCIKHHMDQGMDLMDAREWIDYNYPHAHIVMVNDLPLEDFE